MELSWKSLKNSCFGRGVRHNLSFSRSVQVVLEPPILVKWRDASDFGQKTVVQNYISWQTFEGTWKWCLSTPPLQFTKIGSSDTTWMLLKYYKIFKSRAKLPSKTWVFEIKKRVHLIRLATTSLKHYRPSPNSCQMEWSPSHVNYLMHFLQARRAGKQTEYALTYEIAKLNVSLNSEKHRTYLAECKLGR